MFNKKRKEVIKPEINCYELLLKWEVKRLKRENETLSVHNRLLMEAVEKAGYTIEIVDGDETCCLEMIINDKKIVLGRYKLTKIERT